MNLDPTWRASDILPMVLCSPTLHKAHTYGAVFGQLVHCFVPMVDALGQQLSKLLIVEDLQRASGWDFAHRCGMEAMVVITIPALDKDGTVT